MTTAKLDAPVNKLARLLNSASIKRVLLNDSLRVDFDRIIRDEEVLVVKGALGAMGAGNTSVLMQLLVGMLDAALARQQDLVPAHDRVAVALKVDEAPLVLNRGFAETMALKRSAGLETVACWQVDAQWSDAAVRDQLDALFAHRVYFATASARDARAAVELTMAEFSDTVRPGITQLSTLGRPDVRLHLPKHHAIASWSTHEGRQAPFVAQTMPLGVDQERVSLHASRQLERGGHHLADLTQPHWDRAHRGSHDATSMAWKAGGETSNALTEDKSRVLPAVPAESYHELVELDGAQSVRWAKHVDSPHSLDPDRLDLEMLTLIAGLGHVLTSQIHRHFNAGRAATTTQRRLKRLSDAGLVERFQFHRRDGGGVPMCYVITAAGSRLLVAKGHLGASQDIGTVADSHSSISRARDDSRLRQARHDVHVAGWTLALSRLLGDPSCSVRGPEQSVLSPPPRTGPEGRVPLGPGDLRLPGGRAPHDFVRTTGSGERVEAERFETVRPDAIVAVEGDVGEAHRISRDGSAGIGDAIPGSAKSRSGDIGAESQRAPVIDVIVEFDNRLPSGRSAAKIERYDHFLAGWSAHTGRYGRRMDAVPVVVFVCRDRARARQCATRADTALSACRAYAGEYPFNWEYPGRERILFASERDVHEGLLCAYGVPRLPPEVRVAASRGDPRAGEALVERRTILGGSTEP